MKKLTIIALLAFTLSCAAYPPPAAAKDAPVIVPEIQTPMRVAKSDKPQTSTPIYSPGDRLSIQTGRDQAVDVTVEDVFTETSALTGEKTIYLWVKQEIFSKIRADDPRIKRKAEGARK